MQTREGDHEQPSVAVPLGLESSDGAAAPDSPVGVAEGPVADGVMEAEAMQPFWQFRKAKSSLAVPLPLGHSEMHSIVRFCWA